MILLDAATKSLEVVLGSGVSTQLPVITNWIDLSTATGVAVSGIADTTTVSNNTTAVTAAAAPAASTTRQIKFLCVRNPNTSAVTVKVQINNSGTKRVIVAVSLSPDDTLTYIDGRGVHVQNANGEQKASSVLINLTSQVTGTLPVTNGGTGDATLTAHAVLIGEGTSAVAFAGPGTTGQPLLGVTSGDPAFNAMTLLTTLVDGATPALDASVVPWWVTGVFRLAAAGDRTIAVPGNPVSGQKIVIQHFASGGIRTLALNSGAGGFRFGSDIASLSATASGKTDYIGCIYNSTDSKWDVVAVTKGF